MINNRKLIIAFTLLVHFLSFANTNAYADDAQTEALIEQAIQGQHRSAKNKARDIYRHPKETLTLFGIKPEMKVLEILPGGGWYTEILTPILKDKGQLTVASFGEQHPSNYLRNIHMKFMDKLDSNIELYGKINREIFENKGYFNNTADSSQDMVVTFRNTHNWIRFGGIKETYRAIHRVLKKGGILGVVQHRANKGSDAQKTAQQGYVPESYLIRLIENTGFELVDKSEINANPKDTKDYLEGVWSLPPTYREGDVDKSIFSAIGESDRMTLRFIKL